MTSIPIPVSFATRRKPWWFFATAGAIVLVVAIAAYFITHRRVAVSTGTYFTAKPMDLDVTISKDGELQAANNVDINSPIEGQSTIQDIVKEGIFVHKGDVVVKIDSSDLEPKVETATLELQKSTADVTAAREGKEIQESTNAANLEAANVDLIVARLSMKEYTEGVYPKKLDEAQTAVKMAQIEVDNKDESLSQNKTLYTKGFVTAVNVKEAEVELLKAKNDFRAKQSDLDVLEKYTHEKELTDYKSKVVQAEKKLARTERENASNIAQKISDQQAKEQALVLRKQQFEHLQEQVESCTIKAPADGMVVYSTSGSSSWGRRDTPIQAGAQVRGQELLIRLPDTSQMKAVARIPEAQVNKLRVDPKNPERALVKIVGMEKPLGGWVSNISIMADSSYRWMNPDNKEFPVDISLDDTPTGLKPGTTVDLQIFIERLKNVLAVPLSCIYSAGRDSYVFIREGDENKPLKVTIGSVSDTHAQIKDGLLAGQDVLILQAGQGRELLEHAGIKVQPATQPSEALSTRPPKVMPPQAPGGDAATGGKGQKTSGSRRSRDGAAPVAPAAAPTTAPAK